MGVTGNFRHMHAFRKTLSRLPVTVAHRAAAKAAPHLTDLIREAYRSGRTVYDDPRPLGKRGNRLTLTETGRVARDLHWIAIGTIVRVRLGPSYAKYLVGKYKILPNNMLPAAWQRDLTRIVFRVVPNVFSEGRRAA